MQNGYQLNYLLYFTLFAKIDYLPLKENKDLIIQFYDFVRNNNSSGGHIVNNLIVIFNYDDYFQPAMKISQAKDKEIMRYLDSKIKTSDVDLKKKWIKT